jgi:hypothetical protein
MGKAIKLDKQKQKETEILANRIMPKTDFEKVIEHDKLYFNTLKEALDFNIIKRDVLAKESEKVLKNQTEENIMKNIPLLTEWADTKLKILDLQGKLRVQQTLVDDKIMHFENVFLPQFEKESKEAKENLENALIKANQIVEANEEYFEEICSKLTYELTWWDKVPSERKTNEEYMVQIYKPLKRLISAWEQKKDAQSKTKGK